jgi:hypothetical protein
MKVEFVAEVPFEGRTPFFAKNVLSNACRR